MPRRPAVGEDLRDATSRWGSLALIDEGLRSRNSAFAFRRRRRISPIAAGGGKATPRLAPLRSGERARASFRFVASIRQRVPVFL